MSQAQPAPTKPKGGKCVVILKEPVTKESCSDIKKVRQRVMCTTLQLVKEENKPFGVAIKDAWRKTKEACRIQ